MLHDVQYYILSTIIEKPDSAYGQGFSNEISLILNRDVGRGQIMQTITRMVRDKLITPDPIVRYPTLGGSRKHYNVTEKGVSILLTQDKLRKKETTRELPNQNL